MNPTSPSPRLVEALNTETFKSILESDFKNLLVYFDGPGCFNCVEAWPIFEKTVKVLKQQSQGIRFLYVDLQHNDL